MLGTTATSVSAPVAKSSLCTPMPAPSPLQNEVSCESAEEGGQTAGQRGEREREVCGQWSSVGKGNSPAWLGSAACRPSGACTQPPPNTQQPEYTVCAMADESRGLGGGRGVLCCQPRHNKPRRTYPAPAMADVRSAVDGKQPMPPRHTISTQPPGCSARRPPTRPPPPGVVAPLLHSCCTAAAQLLQGVRRLLSSALSVLARRAELRIELPSGLNRLLARR